MQQVNTPIASLIMLKVRPVGVVDGIFKYSRNRASEESRDPINFEVSILVHNINSGQKANPENTSP